MKLTIKKKKSLFLLIISCFMFFQFQESAKAQLLEEENLNVKEADISPAHLQFNVDLGKTQTQVVEVKNTTGNTQNYKVFYQDFELSNNGKSTFLDAGSSDESLLNFISYTPETMEIAPGETANVSITVTVPADPQALKSAWGVVMVEQVEANSITMYKNTSEEMGNPGYNPSLAYGVWLYQNPPKAEDDNVEITNFIIGNTEKNKGIYLKVKNRGDGVSFCNAFIELTNLSTGEKIVMGEKEYSILPGAKQTLIFEFDGDLPKGSYSAVGVLDNDSEVELVATELKFKIQ